MDYILKSLTLGQAIIGVVFLLTVAWVSRWKISDATHAELRKSADDWQHLYDERNNMLRIFRQKLERSEEKVAELQDVYEKYVSEQRYCRRLARLLKECNIDVPPREEDE